MSLITDVSRLGHMGARFNQMKGTRDARLLIDHKAIKDAHNAWGKVILTHLSPYYGHRCGRITSASLLKKKPGFFKDWMPWAPDTKHLYDTLIADILFTHDLPE